MDRILIPMYIVSNPILQPTCSKCFGEKILAHMRISLIFARIISFVLFTVLPTLANALYFG